MLDHYFYVLMYYEVEQKKRKPKYYLNIEFFLFILTDPITKKAAITFSTGRFVGPANWARVYTNSLYCLENGVLYSFSFENNVRINYDNYLCDPVT